jgi:hypothetical protein
MVGENLHSLTRVELEFPLSDPAPTQPFVKANSCQAASLNVQNGKRTVFMRVAGRHGQQRLADTLSTMRWRNNQPTYSQQSLGPDA